MIKEKNLTIGQCLYNELCSNEYFRIKENVFPREAYIEEFDKICEKQKKHLGLTDELIARIRNEIIYYQRPLKSQKGLVAVCDFEGFYEKQMVKNVLSDLRLRQRVHLYFSLLRSGKV